MTCAARGTPIGICVGRSLRRVRSHRPDYSARQGTASSCQLPRQLGASQQSLLSLPHKRRYSVVLHCSGCSKRTVGFASRQGTQVALLSGSLPEATVSGCARAPGYQQLSRRLHRAANSIHGNCRACATRATQREWHACACATCGERICLRVKPMRRKGGHTLCCRNAQPQLYARGAQSARSLDLREQ